MDRSVWGELISKEAKQESDVLFNTIKNACTGNDRKSRRTIRQEAGAVPFFQNAADGSETVVLNFVASCNSLALSDASETSVLFCFRRIAYLQSNVNNLSFDTTRSCGFEWFNVVKAEGIHPLFLWEWVCDMHKNTLDILVYNTSWQMRTNRRPPPCNTL